ncbi:hypothetical protein V7149_00080 [Bacillus sp. JJ1503]|uniref:hypothetical protein n=1 Tax=Bacillus sp. JJ1503 TaxID=3122956 RepID=UPI003000DF1C
MQGASRACAYDKRMRAVVVICLFIGNCNGIVIIAGREYAELGEIVTLVSEVIYDENPRIN